MKILSFLLAAGVAAAAGRPAFPELLFEENLGQSGAGVRFLARAQGHTVFLGGDEAAFGPVEGAAVRLRFPGARGGRWEAVGEVRDRISYYVGNDASKWVKGARQYAQVAWREAYPGIDIVFYGDGRRLEYDFVVAAGADAGQVRLRFSGAEARLENDGSIVAGSVVQRAPKIYQRNGRTVAGRFVSNGNGEFRLELGDYDRSAALVIDPVVETYHTMGGENDDEIKVVTDVFVAGNTRSVRFVDQQWARRRTRDVFVRGLFGPLSQAGIREQFIGTLVFGGSDDDELGGAASSSFGGVMARVTGTTRSTDLPKAVNRYLGGVSDGFAFGMTTAGTFSGPEVVDSVYLGGSGEDRIHALVSNLNIFVFAGVTDSSDLKTAGALQSVPGGGKDVFVGLLSGFTQRDWSLGYLGGEGDDVAYAAAILPPFQVVVGGETSSGNFPFLASGSRALAGASDGFLTFISTFTSFETGPSITVTSLPITSYLVGGDGADSVRAITSPTRRGDLFDNLLPNVPSNPSLFGVAGVTTSTDLATQGAAQAVLGGESDAFGGIWDLTRREPIWISYAGGSGADAAHGAAMNWYGDLAIGGSTMSRDLPVLDAVQKDPGGGEDGFFALFYRTGAARQVTYFGGAGDDRIWAVSSYGGKTMRVGGVTASSGFRPGVRNYEEGGSGVEGFVASIGTHHLSGPDVLHLPKDGAVVIHFRSNTSELATPITYRSADSSKVRIYRLGGGRAEATIPAEEGVQIEALADAGEVIVAVSAPGHPDREIRVRLYPGVYEFSTVAPPLRVVTTSTTLTLAVAYSAYDEALGRTVGTAFLRQGLAFPGVRWRSSETNILTISPLPNFGPMFASIAGVGEGEARLSAEIEGYRVLEGPVFRVQPFRLRLSGGSFALGKDLSSAFFFREAPVGAMQLTARSSDPSKLLLSAGREGAADGSATFTYRSPQTQQLFAHALADSGEVTVTVSGPGLEADAVFVVKLEPSMVRCGDFSFPPPVRTEVRTVPLRPITFGCQTQGVRDAGAGEPRPGVEPPVLELDNSDPTVVELASVVLESNRQTELIGIKAGSATIGLRRVSGAFTLERDRVPVVVDGPTIDIQTEGPAEIGKDLQLWVSITGPATLEDIEIVAESSDPSALLVSASFETAGSARTVIRRSSGSQYSLFLQALKGSGSATVTIRYPGAPVRTMAVTFLPSTISVDTALGSAGIADGFETRLAVGTFAVDDVSGQRVARQSLRPGLTADVRLRVEGAPVRLSSESMRLGRESGGELFATFPPAGQEAEIVAAATGFEEFPAASRYRLRRPGDPLPERIRPITISEHTVTLHNSSSLNGARRTLKSGDPAKLLISERPDSELLPGLVIPRFQPVYLHPQSSTGVVDLTEHADSGAVIKEAKVYLQPLSVNFGTTALGTTVGVSSRINAPMVGPSVQLRSGLAPIGVTFRSSNEQVARVTPERFTYRPGESFAMPMLVGVAEGEAEIVAVPDDGTPAVRSSVAVIVRRPAASADREIIVGKNLQASMVVRVTGAAPASGAILTVTSTDPSKVLVSRTDSPGAASVVVAVQPGSFDSQPLFVQALSDEGVVALRVSGGGYADSEIRVRLAAVRVSLAAEFQGPLAVGSSFRVRVGSTVDGIQPNQPVVLTRRAGAPIPKVRLVSSNPDVAEAVGEAELFSTVEVRAKALGTAFLRAETPEGFGESEAVVGVTVREPILATQCGQGVYLGKEMQRTCQISAPAGTRISVRSMHAPLAVVSFSATAFGSGEISITGGPFTVQGLAARGTTEIVLSAPGFQTTRIPVILRPVRFSAGTSSGATLGVGGQTGFNMVLDVVAPPGTSNPIAVRAGSRITLTPEFTPAGIVTMTPAAIEFGPGESRKESTLRGVAAGTTILRWRLPDGVETTTPPLPITVR